MDKLNFSDCIMFFKPFSFKYSTQKELTLK